MKTLIVYDSLYGNTAKIAKVIQGVIGDDSRVMPVGGAKASDLAGVELLIIGSPTHGGKPTSGIMNFISRIKPAELRRMRVAVFDTRVEAKFARFFGFAAEKIAQSVEHKHGRLLTKPEGFIVLGKEGPLRDIEIDRAAAWAKRLVVVAPVI